MRVFLEWIEIHADIEITEDKVRAFPSGNNGPLIVNIDLVEASNQMWAYLNMNLQGSVTEVFHNVEMLKGAEAWRRIVGPISNHGEARRKALRWRAWNPRAATKASDSTNCLEAWETDWRHFTEAWGDQISDETRRGLLIDILPGDMTHYGLIMMKNP